MEMAVVDLLREMLQTTPRLGRFVIVCGVLILLVALMVKFGLLSIPDSPDELEDTAAKHTNEQLIEACRKSHDLNSRILTELVKNNKNQEQIIDELQLLREHLLIVRLT